MTPDRNDVYNHALHYPFKGGGLWMWLGCNGTPRFSILRCNPETGEIESWSERREQWEYHELYPEERWKPRTQVGEPVPSGWSDY